MNMKFFSKKDKDAIEAERIARIKADIEAAKELRLKKEREIIATNKEKCRKFLLTSKKLRELIVSKNNDSTGKLFDQCIAVYTIYVSDISVTRAMIQDITKDLPLATLVIEILSELGLIVGETRNFKFCTIDYIDAMLLNPIGIINNAMNRRILKKAEKNFLYQMSPDGKVKIHKHPKYMPLTEEQKALMLAKAKEDEHRRRVGVSSDTHTAITEIQDGVEIEIQRIKAERKLMIESYKPYFIAVSVLLVIVWFINGLSQM